MNLKSIKYLFFVVILGSFFKSFCGTIIYFPQTNITIKREDPYKGLRNFLYKMENNLSLIEDIQKNKIFYTVILESHIRHLQKRDTERKATTVGYSLGLACMPAILFGYSAYDIVNNLDFYLKYDHFGIKLSGACGAIAAFFGWLAYLGHSHITEYTQIKTERDQRIINKLNQL